ncbi:ROK family transcriptional regulator [Nocardioides gansuensis]|uniref:ROK family transcriptional regulator n=1 Tax=Nocardioides gansuensis TaxID=2138300 RepID=A0A2T8F7C3_9ACTN|nr:ROK family transcriptional regulator [Nocardioides gansuensis]PVG81610.1 ROK family transcriptional regulator [Nocardioides gansuensis]
MAENDRATGPGTRGVAVSTVRAGSRTVVLDLLSRSAPVSRAEVARLTGLSRSTVSGIVQELLVEGVVQESRGVEPARGGGRPPTLISLRGEPGVLVGVDIGHRHVRVAVADLSAVPLAEEARPVDVDHSADEALDLAAELVQQCLVAAGIGAGSDRIVGVGMGVPGPVHPRTGIVVSPILPSWVGRSPAWELARRLGRPVHVDNDANIGALGEVRHGAARGHSDVIYVKASSGIGAGLVLAGKLYRGATGIAGEIGHVRFDDDGPVCRCGNRGCLETAVAGPKLVELLQPAYGPGLTVGKMLELGREGDVGVTRILDDAGRSLGRVIADLCNHLNPEIIVIGGDMRVAPSFLRGIRDSIDRYAQPDTARALTVVPGVLGDRAGVVGALVVAQDDTAVVGLPSPA